MSAQKASKGYVKIPRSVLFDGALSDLDLRVYAILSSHTHRDTGRAIKPIGSRLLARLASARRASVGKSLQALRDRGHIATYGPQGRGKRAIYVMTSGWFASKVAAPAETVWEGNGVKVVKSAPRGWKKEAAG